MDKHNGVAAIEAARQRMARDRGEGERVAQRTPAEPSGMPAKLGREGSRLLIRRRLPTVGFEALPADADGMERPRATVRIRVKEEAKRG